MMTRFKKGDLVQYRATAEKTAVWKVKSIRANGRYDLECVEAGKSSNGNTDWPLGFMFYESPNCGQPGWEKIGESLKMFDNSATTMEPEKCSLAGVVVKYKASKLKEPQKSFYELGIADINGKFNYEGNQLFQEFVQAKLEDDFKTEVVDKLLAIKNEGKETK